MRSFKDSITRAAAVLSGVAILVTAADARHIEVIYTKIPTHPTSIVPGALDLNGDPEVTNFRALEDLFVSPTGSLWLLKGRTQQGSDLENIMILGSDLSGTMFAQEGQQIPDAPAGELYDFFGSGIGRFNTLDEFAYTARARGGASATAQKVMLWDGTDFHVIAQQGDPYDGLEDSPPANSGDELIGNSIGSLHIQDDGTLGAQDSTIQNIHSTRRPAIFYKTIDMTNFGMFHQTNVTSVPDLGGTPLLIKTLTANAFYTAPDGSAWMARGQLQTGGTTDDDVLIVNGQTVIQEGNPLDTGLPNVASVFAIDIANNGHWYARGSFAGGGVWAVHNGVVVARTGEPITTGSSENWGATFLSFNGNSDGDWVLVGTTDNADPAVDTVMVLNGTTVLAREGDPVDLDGNGQFDDDVFIGRGNNTLSAWEPNDTVIAPNRVVYFLASIRDGAGNDLNSDPAFTSPQAFMRIVATAIPGDINDDGMVNLADLSLLLESFGTCVGDPDYNPAADIDDDGCVGLSDLSILLSNFSTGH